jgi:hypothetical protein
MVKLAPLIMVKLALRLRVVEHPSRGCQRVPFLLLRSTRSSSQCGSDPCSYGRWNDHENDHTAQAPPRFPT